MKAVDPKTPEEWQMAVDAAEFFISIDACRQYGLMEGGPKVNVDRARDLLERGRVLGYSPRPFDELVRMFKGVYL